MTATSTIAGAQGSPVSFRATAVPPHVTATIVGGGATQTGAVGSQLADPLRIQVQFGGAPKAGVAVHWSTPYGSLQPAEDTTDAGGFAEARWTLGTVARFVTAGATVEGMIGAPVVFVAQALAGPAAAIQTASGSGQTFPANRTPVDPLVALVTDRYGNWVQGQAVTWSVERGPIEFSAQGGATDASGRSISAIAASGEPEARWFGPALPGGGAADFTLTVAPELFEVRLNTLSGYAFISLQNHSSGPAVDTIPAGRTMEWTLEFDYGLHGVASVGTPAFQGGDFPYIGLPRQREVRHPGHLSLHRSLQSHCHRHPRGAVKGGRTVKTTLVSLALLGLVACSPDSPTAPAGALAVAGVGSAAAERISMCHRSGSGGVIIEVPPAEVAAHVRQGDYLIALAVSHT